MCFEDRLFRSWTTQKVRSRERNAPVIEPDRAEVKPSETALGLDTTKHRQETERELEELV